jgi:hypothetical protein
MNLVCEEAMATKQTETVGPDPSGKRLLQLFHRRHREAALSFRPDHKSSIDPLSDD